MNQTARDIAEQFTTGIVNGQRSYYVEKLAEAIEQYAARDWIPVSDPPEEGGYKLCCSGNSLPFVAMYYDEGRWSADTIEVKPSHWMPLPPKPE